MELSAIYHRPKLNWANAYDKRTVELRLRTKRGDIKAVTLYAGDKYGWPQTELRLPMAQDLSDALYDYWLIRIEPPFKRLRYAFLLDDGRSAMWMTEHGFHADMPDNLSTFFDFPYIHPADLFAPPEWVQDAVFYQIFPERFANGDRSNDPETTEAWGGKPLYNNFFGGDLQGVIDHLDHLTGLGVNAIYFTPVFEAPTNHKYDTTDYMQVDSHLGTNELLKQLVDACHQRGIRVLLDAVFNHAGSRFEPFLDVQKHGEQSRYKDWFHVREWPLAVIDRVPTYETFAFEPHMPKLNTENPEVKDYLFRAVKYWTELGIDGWRLDVANEVDHQFWREFRQLVKSINPDAYILGEIWHDSIMWLQGDQFDAVMNYTFTISVLDYIAERRLDARGIADRLSTLLANHPTRVNASAFNLLDSHDTPRLLTQCGQNKAKLKLATVLQFTFTGTPCIYYGDEVGLDGEQDPDCRKCMEWDASRQDQELLAHYRALIALRMRHAALRTGSFRVLHAEAEGWLLAYERADEQTDERFMVIMNNSEDEAAVPPALLQGAAEIMLSSWQELGNGAGSPGGRLPATLPAYGFMICRLG